VNGKTEMPAALDNLNQTLSMDASATFSLRAAERSDAQAEKPKRATLQRIATGIGLVGLAVGFSILGTLIIMNRHRAHLNDLPGGGFIALLGGICGILAGAVFFVAYCLHWRFWAKQSAAFSANRQTARLTRRDPTQESLRCLDRHQVQL
jgi:hypothetical protein